MWTPARLCINTPSNLMFFLFPSLPLPALGCSGDIEGTMFLSEVRLLLCSHLFHRPLACPATCALFAPPCFLKPIYSCLFFLPQPRHLHTTVHVPSCLNGPFSGQYWPTLPRWVIQTKQQTFKQRGLSPLYAWRWTWWWLWHLDPKRHIVSSSPAKLLFQTTILVNNVIFCCSNIYFHRSYGDNHYDLI